MVLVQNVKAHGLPSKFLNVHDFGMKIYTSLLANLGRQKVGVRPLYPILVCTCTEDLIRIQKPVLGQVKYPKKFKTPSQNEVYI